MINHKKVSHDHAEFTVGAYTHDDVVSLLLLILYILRVFKSFRNSRTL